MSSNQTISPRLSGVLLAILGTFLFALKSIFIKLCYAEGASTDEVLLMRMIIAAPFYIAMLVYLKKRNKIKAPLDTHNTTRVLALGFIGYYLASYLDLSGLQYISAQLERLTLFTYPTMVAVLAWLLLGEKLTKSIIISLILSYAGILTIYSQEINITGSANVSKGVLLVLGSALSYSVYVIFAKGYIKQLGSRAFTSIAMLGSTLFVCVHFSIKHPLNLDNVSTTVWIYATLLAFVCTVIPSFMITEAIARIGATHTNIIGSVGPVFTIILAVFIIHEPFTAFHAIGVAMVLIGVSCISITGK